MAKTVKEKPVGIDAILAKLNKDFGKGSVMSLNDKISGDYDVIPTGSIKYDHIVLGIGGFAKGKLYEIRGWEGSGKTTVCGHAAASCQREGGRVVYIDGEHALDKHYFEALGVDINTMLVSQPDYGEEGFTVAMSLIESGEVDLVIIDSDSSLLPKAVMEGEIGASNIGKKAKLNSDVYPKIKSAAAKNGVCVIIISQYRNQIGIMFGDPKTTQGGKALGFYADTIIEMTKTLKKEDDVAAGNITKLKTIKNKTAPPFREAKVDVIFGEGFDIYGEVIDLAKEFEIIKVWGKKTTHNEVEYETEGYKEMLKSNPEYYQTLKADVVKKLSEIDIPVFEPPATEEDGE